MFSMTKIRNIILAFGAFSCATQTPDAPPDAGLPPSTPDASARDAAPDVTPHPAVPPAPRPHADMGDAGHHILGSLLREYAFIPDAGMAITTYDDPNTGRQDVWFQNVGGVAGPPTGAAGGDLSGTYPNPTVSGLETKALPALPGSDQYLHYTGSGWGFSALPTAVTVAAGNSGITVSGGPAYSISNADTFTAGSGISVTGGPPNFTITNTAAFSNNVPSGATGFTSCAAGDYVSGNGTSPLVCTHLTQHQVALGEGAFPPGGAGPGTLGQVLTSAGASADPSFLSLPATNWSGNKAVAITSSSTYVTLASISYSTGSNVYYFTMTGAVECYSGPGNDVINYGIGTSSSTPSWSHNILFPGTYPTSSSSFSGGITYRSSLSGTFTIYLIAENTAAADASLNCDGDLSIITTWF